MSDCFAFSNVEVPISHSGKIDLLRMTTRQLVQLVVKVFAGANQNNAVFLGLGRQLFQMAGLAPDVFQPHVPRHYFLFMAAG